MGIFDNLFGSRDYKLPEIPNTSVGEAVTDAQRKEEERKRAMPAYQIGRTEDGRVTLNIGDPRYGGSTLTMNNEGVDILIRMLEAAKATDLEVKDNFITNDEEDDDNN